MKIKDAKIIRFESVEDLKIYMRWNKGVYYDEDCNDVVYRVEMIDGEPKIITETREIRVSEYMIGDMFAIYE